MSAEEKPSYEELARRNDSLARQVIGYQMRVNDSLASIVRKAKAEAWEEGYDAGQGDGHTGITENNLNPYEAAP